MRVQFTCNPLRVNGEKASCPSGFSWRVVIIADVCLQRDGNMQERGASTIELHVCLSSHWETLDDGACACIVRSASLCQSLEKAGGGGGDGFFFDATALGRNMAAPVPVLRSVSAFSLRFFDRSLTSARILRPL